MTDQTMTADMYYQAVMQRANLRTRGHATRLSAAVLQALGFNLSGGVKRKLAKALPPELAHELTRAWKLIHFRNRNLTVDHFAKDVSLHSGNTDPAFNEHAMRAVFHMIKHHIDPDLSRTVAKDLSPELRKFWNAA